MHVHHDQTFQLEQRIQPNESSGNAMAATSVELDQVHQATEAIQRSWSPMQMHYVRITGHVLLIYVCVLGSFELWFATYRQGLC